MSEDIRYPVGKWGRESALNGAARAACIQAIADVPASLSAALAGLTDAQLDTPYRDGGWSPRQITHHLADSHMNAFTRFKLGLTEDTPTIKPYDENIWAETADNQAPVATSVGILTGLHHRWALLLRSLEEPAFGRMIQHPERGPMSLTALLGLYAWHGRHHVAQITAQRVRNGW
ncbi:MAG: putative metal-dependent hydrolase [Acidimicrobiia bacterium]|nr:putative metal-dependent hydrolase [Acidimicrobiia bacterium]